MKYRASTKTRDALRRVENEFGCEVVLYSGYVGEDGYGQLLKVVTDIDTDKRLLLMLSTYGGDADSAYKIARYCQNSFIGFDIYVPGPCKSAGTLIVLGAETILMSPFSELGPLDVQLYKPDELFEPRSGLLINSTIDSLTEKAFSIFEHFILKIRASAGGVIRFKTSSDLAERMVGNIITPIAGQIDPATVGEDHQDLRIAEEYGKRLISMYNAVTYSTVRNLIYQYPSHDFVIDLHESRRLFSNLELASEDLIHISTAFSKFSLTPDYGKVTVVNLSREWKSNEEEGDTQSSGNDEAKADKRPGVDGKREATRSNKPSGRGDRSSNKQSKQTTNASGASGGQRKR